MLVLIFLYYIGKTFYNLPLDYGKNNPWGFAILGIASYYLSIFIGAIIVTTIITIFLPEYLETVSDTAIGVMAIPFGLLGCWGTYKIIEKRFQNNPEGTYDGNILDETL